MFFKPKIKLDKVTDIDSELLSKNGITALILDVDNTLSTHHGQILTDGLSEWLKKMQDEGIKLTILSNSNKKRLEPFAQKINLEYISLGLKPLPFGYFRALRALNVSKKNAAIVGDQIFTDILGGNLIGLNTILLTPIKPETSAGFRFKRKIEKMLLNYYKL